MDTKRSLTEVETMSSPRAQVVGMLLAGLVSASALTAPTADVRDMLPDRYVQTLFLNNTSAIQGLYQFDAPSSPEKWERIWSEVEAA